MTTHHLIATGTPAPWVTGVTDQDGNAVELSQYLGGYVVLYWYPKDDTPGCTVEACNFRDHAADIDAHVLGVSADDAASHQAFKAKFALSFPLLVDPDGQLGALYGAQPAGTEYPRRVTFLIDPAGVIVEVWPDVDPASHWQQIQAAIA